MPKGRSAQAVADRERCGCDPGVPCTLIDNGMPVIVMRAADLGRTGHEPRDQLDKDGELKARIEAIRREAGPLMNLGDVSGKVCRKSRWSRRR